MLGYIKSKLANWSQEGDDQNLNNKPRKDPKSCLHANLHSFSEGVRFCADCGLVERFEKQRVPEPGQEPWYWRELSRDEAIAVIEDIRERINA